MKLPSIARKINLKWYHLFSDLLSDISDHVFHLHGQRFHVTSLAKNIPLLPVSELKKLDEKGLLLKRRNLIDPVIKDTITVPRSSAVALRFKADNPGNKIQTIFNQRFVLIGIFLLILT